MLLTPPSGLLIRGSDINACDPDFSISYYLGPHRFTTLHFAAIDGLKAVIEALLEKGCDINMRGLNDRTALQWAVSVGRVEVVKLLLREGCGVEVAAEGGRRAIHMAADFGGKVTVGLLLKKGCSIKARDSLGLFLFCFNHKRDSLGQTPLHIGVDHLGVVKLLVKKGCSVDARNEGGETPLHLSRGVFRSVG